MNSPIAGIGFKTLSALLFSIMTAIVKLLSDEFPMGQIVFARSFFALIPIMIMLLMQGQFPAALRTERPWGHLWRGIVGGGGMGCSFLAIAYLPLHDAVAIGYAAPLITVALAPILLKERVGIYRASAVAVGLAGVLLIMSPHLAVADFSGAGPQTGVMVALAGALFVSLAMIQVRQLTQTERNGTIVFYFSLVTSVAGLSTLIFGWEMPDAKQGMLLVLSGLLGGVAQICLTQSYRLAPVTTIASFDYTTMLWALIMGYFLFGDVPEPVVIVGAFIVIMAGLFVIFREHQLGLKRAAAPGVRNPQI